MRIFGFIAAKKAEHSISIMCRVLGVSRSGFHAWQARKPSKRALEDARLSVRIAEIHGRFRGVYGSPRIHAELVLGDGERLGRKCVERLMRAAGISGMVRRRRGTTIRVPGVRVCEDLVDADHISGFDVAGDIIRQLEPELVVQPWTEDPQLAPDATAPPTAAPSGGASALIARLANMQAIAQATNEAVAELEASPSVRRTVREQVAFLGETNLANAGAVQNLMTMGKRPPVYASFGTELPLEDLLPGVGVEVLGPPTLEQTRAIARQRATDPDEFWHLAASTAVAAQPQGTPTPLFPDAVATSDNLPQEARWVAPAIERMRSEEMLAIVRSLDSALNNTSLILLFEVGDTRLLFPGDAQIENWSYALSTAPNHEEIRERLAGVRFYKVGHHGSLNATPKESLWQLFAHKGESDTPGRLTTMVSTVAGKHGSVDRGTEVPRKLLLAELDRMSDLHDTETLESAHPFWNDVEFEL